MDSTKDSNSTENIEMKSEIPVDDKSKDIKDTEPKEPEITEPIKDISEKTIDNDSVQPTINEQEKEESNESNKLTSEEPDKPEIPDITNTELSTTECGEADLPTTAIPDDEQTKIDETLTVNSTINNQIETEISETPLSNNITKTLGNLSKGFREEGQFIDINCEILFVDIVKPEYICEQCQFILWNPLKLKCGHIICNTCKGNMSIEENKAILCCDIDKEVMTIEEIDMLDETNIEILNLKVHCITPFCTWLDSLKNLNDHYKTCELRQEKCPQCEVMISINDFENHKLNTCEYRMIKCQHCSNSVYAKDTLLHEESCKERLIECPNQCKQSDDKTKYTILKQGFLKVHLDNVCPERKIPCLFEKFNCQKKTKYKKLHQHLQKYGIVHLDDLCSFSKKTTETLEKQVRAMLQLKESIQKNEIKVNNLNSELGTQLLWKIENIMDKYQAALNGAREEIISNHFFSTSPYGYKFIMRLVFSVNNTKVSNHFISLYLSICDSPYNVLLTWPLNLKFNIHIVDQKSDKHISHCFIPNPIIENFPFINRPKSERNPYFGIEKFANCNILFDNSSFTVDNTMFIKINIEPHNIV